MATEDTDFEEIQAFYKLKLEYDYLMHKKGENELTPEIEDHLKLVEEKFLSKKDEMIQSGKLNIMTEEQAKSMLKNISDIYKTYSHKLDPESAKQFCQKFIHDRNDYIGDCELIKLEENNYCIKTPTGKLKPFTEILRGTNGVESKSELKKLNEGWQKVKEKASKETDIRIRMTMDEKEKIQENAKKHGCTNVSEYIRDVAISEKSTIYKYELSNDKLGLTAFFRFVYDPTQMGTYHIHSDEMTPDQKIIHQLLLMNRVLSLELQGVTK